MKMKNWRQMLRGDMSSLKEKKEEAIIPENAIYRIHWRSGQRSNLVDHDAAVRRVNEQMNHTGWEWMKVVNTETKQQQIVYEPKFGNRGFHHLKGLNENEDSLSDLTVLAPEYLSVILVVQIKVL